MLIPDAMRQEPICGQKRGMRLRMALAGLVAGNLLLIPILAEAAVQNAKPGHAPKTVVVPAPSPSAANAAPRVSPYAIANRQRVTEAKNAHAPVPQLTARRIRK
jgi:hypothetical protein